MRHLAILLLLLCYALPVALSQATISTVVPAQNGLNISASSSIELVFSEAMNMATMIADSTINITGSLSGMHTGVITYNSGTFTATYDPATDFKAGEAVTVTATAGIKNMSAVGILHYSWRFAVTASSADSFAAKVDYETGDAPRSLVSADLDGDGDMDLAGATSGLNLVSVLKNNGAGTFAADIGYGTNNFPYAIVSADLDGDGDMDLASTNINFYAVSVFKNVGDGTFAARTDYATQMHPYSLTVADLDGDGDMDLVSGNNGAASVTVLKNQGDGTFAAGVHYPTGSQPRSISSADLDGDGDMDLAVGNGGDANVSVLMNSGNGAFSTGGTYGTGTQPYSMTSADLDGDGDVDLVTGNNGAATLSVLKNNGDGSFAAKVDYGLGSLPSSVVSADVDGDGDMDLAATNSSSNSLSILRNDGTGAFSTKIDHTTALLPSAVTAADLDGDGDIDLAVANQNSDSLSVFMNSTYAELPVEVVSITASAVRLGAIVIWKTASEVNNYGFEIERRLVLGIDAGMHLWSKVGFVAGAGTSSGPREYSFVDRDVAPGRYAYRIKQIDHDGSISDAGEAEVEVGLAPKELSLGQNYPNPFNPTTMIEFTVPQDGRAVLRVFNLLGEEVATLFDGEAQAGRIVRSSFDARSLAGGMYFARLESGGSQLLRSLLLVK